MPRRSVFALVALGPSVALALLAAPGAARAAITVYPVHGLAGDATEPPHGPGLLIMGGGEDVDAAFRWMHDTITGDAQALGGDVVVLRAPGSGSGGDDAYGPYLLAAARFHSVRTVVLTSPASAGDVAAAAFYLDRAEGIFFAGGDQSDYVGWGADLFAAVQRAYDRGAVVGGTSAGADVLGEFVNDAIGERHHPATESGDAIADPFEPSITLSRDLLRVPPLAGAVVDTHFRSRDRLGRLAVYMARAAMTEDAPGEVLGIGVDEASALVVDRDGRASLLTQVPGAGAAWVLRGGAPSRLAPGQPLAHAITVTRLDRPGARTDLVRRCGGGVTYAVTIDGARSAPYEPAIPYDGAGGEDPCPDGWGVSSDTPDAGGRPGAGEANPSIERRGCACGSRRVAGGGGAAVACAVGLLAGFARRRARPSARSARGA